MVFACQEDSYRKEYSTKVVSCEQVNDPDGAINIIGDKRSSLCYEIVMENTILFPEGGGQPDDRGTIDQTPVIKVSRRGQDAVHLVTESIKVGATVQLKVDWERRFDHMQQHTGQHLVTAVAESTYGFKTTSWNLGERISFVELNTPTVTEEQIDRIERDCNDKIREQLPVDVTLHEHLSSDVRSRLLPDDHVGPIRVVSIRGIDENTCCGTHVSNLSHLQIVKLLYAEKGKKNNSNLFFIVGDRVKRFVAECVRKDKQLTARLNGGPDRHVELVDKIQRALRISQKNEVSLMRDLATLEAERFKMIEPRPKFFSIHRREGNAEFMNTIATKINDDSVLLFLTVGDEIGAGQLLLYGKPELVQDLSPKVLEILDAKGSSKGCRLNGKVGKMSQRPKVEQFLKEALNI